MSLRTVSYLKHDFSNLLQVESYHCEQMTTKPILIIFVGHKL